MRRRDWPGYVMGGFIVVIMLCALMAGVTGAFTKAQEPLPAPTVTETAYATLTPAPAPTVTVTATPKPRPTKTVYVTPASRSQPRASRPNVTRGSWSQGEWDRFPGYVEAAALCVAKHESWGRLWYGENPISTASGAFQWIDSTWVANARRAGVSIAGGHASNAPPRDQAKVFAWMWTHGGKKAWRGTNCPGTE